MNVLESFMHVSSISTESFRNLREVYDRKIAAAAADQLIIIIHVKNVNNGMCPNSEGYNY